MFDSFLCCTIINNLFGQLRQLFLLHSFLHILLIPLRKYCHCFLFVRLLCTVLPSIMYLANMRPPHTLFIVCHLSSPTVSPNRYRQTARLLKLPVAKVLVFHSPTTALVMYNSVTAIFMYLPVFNPVLRAGVRPAVLFN